MSTAQQGRLRRPGSSWWISPTCLLCWLLSWRRPAGPGLLWLKVGGSPAALISTATWHCLLLSAAYAACSMQHAACHCNRWQPSLALETLCCQCCCQQPCKHCIAEALHLHLHLISSSCCTAAALNHRHLDLLRCAPPVLAMAAVLHLAQWSAAGVSNTGAVMHTIIPTISKQFKTCPPHILNSRLADLGVERPGRPGSAGRMVVMPEDLVGHERHARGAGEVPRVLLCWDGPEPVVQHLMRMLGTGQLQQEHMTAYHLSLLAALPDPASAIATLQKYTAMLASGDVQNPGGLLPKLTRLGCEALAAVV